ncbi:MAG TPA: penicillin-binding transpeptidase domain-containing protein [Acidimicrobiales bacterium]|jgi:peptidoglycan glycosyltransferase|nr:penicillin-binding transpeptidase domain-containing protein [Acidimicrobiales bacterium]
MKGRITALSVIIVLLFGLVLGQAWFIQVHRASALNHSTRNPTNLLAGRLYPRGEILSVNGTVLARSIPTGDASSPWRRSYPLGALTSDVVGYSSVKYGTGGIEYEYDGNLITHTQPARSISELIAPTRANDTVQLTLSVPLQQVAARALAGRDGAVVAIDPRNGAVLAMYSNPTYNPAPLTSTNYGIQTAAWNKYNTNDPLHFPPLGSVATQETFPPGSTSKVLTTAAIYRYFPGLANVPFPSTTCLNLVPFGGSPLHPLCNSGLTPCGGTIQYMLPASCDPGYGWLGIHLGAQDLTNEARQFGYNAIPPLDLPGVVPSYFPPPGFFVGNLPGLAYSAIGQQNVRATALQDALIAAAVANGGKEMAPHFLSLITDQNGGVVERYRPYMWRHPIGPSMAAMITTLMKAVVTGGTASQVGFLSQDDVAAKTGTAQTGDAQNHIDAWMIAFAPASNPAIAVAVVLPQQAFNAWGATTAGPVMKCVIEGALALDAKQPPSGTYTTCPR